MQYEICQLVMCQVWPAGVKGESEGGAGRAGERRG